MSRLASSLKALKVHIICILAGESGGGNDPFKVQIVR